MPVSISPLVGFKIKTMKPACCRYNKRVAIHPSSSRGGFTYIPADPVLPLAIRFIQAAAIDIKPEKPVTLWMP